MYLPFGNHLFSFKMITLKVKVKKWQNFLIN